MNKYSNTVGILYIIRCWFVMDDILFFSLYSFCCIAWQLKTLKLLGLVYYFDTSVQMGSALALVSKSHYCLQYHLHPTPPITLEWVPIHPGWCWMCIYALIGCTYCSEPYSVSWRFNEVPDHCWTHICDNGIEIQIQLTRFVLHQYPHLSPSPNSKLWQKRYFPN